jgi:predicted CXXCH cytochrome family protein
MTYGRQVRPCTTPGTTAVLGMHNYGRRSPLKRIPTPVAVIVLAIGMGLSARAAQHPVPLEKGVQETKCLECHEDKTKGKVVHPAVAMGCFTCHSVRVNPNDTRIVLKSGRPAALCIQCHADKKADNPLVKVHPPAVNDCLKCHDPHVSTNEKLLLKAETGDKKENLCLTCHTQGVDTPKGGSKHAALDMGCNACHTTHKTGDRTKFEFQYHLNKVAPALCMDCHDVKDAALAKAHQNQPFAAANCLNCHDPHDSKSPKLMRAYLHQPFEGKACDTCHEAPKENKVVLTQPEAKAICATCHDEVAKKIETAKVPHPGAQMDCTSCHNPHAGKGPRFLSPSPVEACLSCHENQAQAYKTKKVLHDPVFNQKCSICHEAHGGTRDKLLRDNVDELCLTCHNVDAKALKSTEGGTETIFGKAVTLPAGYVAKTPKIPITRPGGLGHPVPAHPTQELDPRDKNKKMSCVSCHDPHAGDAKNMLVSEKGSVRAMCHQCHKNME